MITNIRLEKNRFIVFATNFENEESNSFMPEVTLQEIIDWDLSRAEYFENLKHKEEEFKRELNIK